MGDEETKPKTVSVQDAIRLKHGINKSSIYGGMNAQEYHKFCKMTVEDWTRVRKQYDAWIRSTRVVSPIWFWIWLAAGVAATYFFQRWLKLIGTVILVLTFYQVVRRGDHREGYMDGYEAGRQEGIDKALGITDENAKDAADRRVEMEVDERTISAFDKKSTGEEAKN